MSDTSRPSMNDPGSRMVWQPWSEIQSDPHVEAIFHVHCVYTSRFLPIPFLFWNGENSSFSSDFRGLFWAWQRRETHRWSPNSSKQEGVPDKNRKLRHLEVLLAAAGASAKYPWVSCQEPPLSIVGFCTQEHIKLQEEGLPSSTCPKQDTPNSHSGFLGTPLPVLCIYSWAPAPLETGLLLVSSHGRQTIETIAFKIKSDFIVLLL